MRVKTKDLRKGDIIFFRDHTGCIVGIVTKAVPSRISPEDIRIVVKYIEHDGEIAYDTFRTSFGYEFSKVIRE
jgi:hypothetical protein